MQIQYDKISLEQPHLSVDNSKNLESSAIGGDSRTKQGETFIRSEAHWLLPVLVTKQGDL